jgi:hypothetical protein
MMTTQPISLSTSCSKLPQCIHGLSPFPGLPKPDQDSSDSTKTDDHHTILPHHPMLHHPITIRF